MHDVCECSHSCNPHPVTLVGGERQQSSHQDLTHLVQPHTKQSCRQADKGRGMGGGGERSEMRGCAEAAVDRGQTDQFEVQKSFQQVHCSSLST